jgi:DNA invertase Pin-like site-specific DNA recombinase
MAKRDQPLDSHLDDEAEVLPGPSLAFPLGIPNELIFVGRKSGTDAEREGLKAMLACARPGDTVVVQEMARIGRDLDEVSSLVRDLAEQGIIVRPLPT